MSSSRTAPSTAFALWNPGDLGYLAAYAAKALVDGDITGEEGDTFEAGELGEFRSAPTASSCSATRSSSTPTTSTTSTSESAPSSGPAPAGAVRPGPHLHPPTTDPRRRHRCSASASSSRSSPTGSTEYTARHAAVWPEMLRRSPPPAGTTTRCSCATTACSSATSRRRRLEAAQRGHGRHRRQRPLAGRDGRVLRGPRRRPARHRASSSSSEVFHLEDQLAAARTDDRTRSDVT